MHYVLYKHALSKHGGHRPSIFSEIGIKTVPDVWVVALR